MRINWHQISWQNPRLMEMEVGFFKCCVCNLIWTDVFYTSDINADGKTFRNPTPCGHLCGVIIGKERKRGKK